MWGSVAESRVIQIGGSWIGFINQQEIFETMNFEFSGFFTLCLLRGSFSVGDFGTAIHALIWSEITPDGNSKGTKAVDLFSKPIVSMGRVTNFFLKYKNNKII